MTSSLMRHAMPVNIHRQPESRSSAAWRATRYAIVFCSAGVAPASHSASNEDESYERAKQELGADLRSAGVLCVKVRDASTYTEARQGISGEQPTLRFAHRTERRNWLASPYTMQTFRRSLRARRFGSAG